MTRTFTAEVPSPAPVTAREAAAEASLPPPVRTAEVARSLTRHVTFNARLLLGLCWCWCLGLASGRRLPMHYPWHFKSYLAVVVVTAASWIGNYALVVSPAIEAIDTQPCTDLDGIAGDDQLTYNAKMLFVYFIWFAVARTLLFIPCIASRVATLQSRTHGFCCTYWVHLIIRDGPLYIFVIGSMLFWFHLMQNPYCEKRSLSMYQTLRLYAMYSCLISVLCMFLAYWHNKLIMDAVRSRGTAQSRGAPPGTLQKLETRAYDETLFGDEEGKPYPSECAICLGNWEEEDVIKVTPCGHAFHEECLGGWFRTSRTCALCRQDCTSTTGSSGNPFDWQMSSPMPRVVGASTNLAAGTGSTTTSSDDRPGSPTVVI